MSSRCATRTGSAAAPASPPTAAPWPLAVDNAGDGRPAWCSRAAPASPRAWSCPNSSARRAVGNGGAWLVAEHRNGDWNGQARVLWRPGQAAISATQAALGPDAVALLIIPEIPKPAGGSRSRGPGRRRWQAGQGAAGRAASVSAPASGGADQAGRHPGRSQPLRPDDPRPARASIPSARWLAGGGRGASAAAGGSEDTDPFRHRHHGRGPRSSTTVLGWRWKDSSRGSRARPPAHGRASSPYNLRGRAPGQVVCWQGDEVSTLDFSGDSPVERPLFTAAAPASFPT